MANQVLTLNQISVKGLDRLPRDIYEIASEFAHPDAILLPFPIFAPALTVALARTLVTEASISAVASTQAASWTPATNSGGFTPNCLMIVSKAKIGFSTRNSAADSGASISPSGTRTRPALVEAS